MSIAKRAAASLSAQRSRIAGMTALIGFDGFVDTICHVVSARSQPGDAGYRRIERIDDFAERIRRASGASANIELAVQRVQVGGNAPLMAGALMALGAPVTLIGSVGKHPIFEHLNRQCSACYALSPPGQTDALEFCDGKIMLGIIAPLDDVTWDRIIETVGSEGAMRRLLEGSRLVAAVNWTMICDMTRIWSQLAQMLEQLPAQDPARWLLIDMADPAKRSDDDLLEAMAPLRALARQSRLAMGLNISEAQRLSSLLHCDADIGRSGAGAPCNDALLQAANCIRSSLGACVVAIHHPLGAVACSKDAQSHFASSHVASPVASTGAGDHFNAGLTLGLMLSLPLDESLAIGVGVSGWRVRTGEAPSLDQLIEFLPNQREAG